MRNPYEDYATAKETGILSGARVALNRNMDDLHSRLAMMACYLTERQQTTADALFVMDLHDAATFIRRNRKSPNTGSQP